MYAELEHRVRDRTAAPQQANEEIRQLAVTDAMTGLTDRRCFYLLPSKSYGGHITTALSACRQPSAWCGAGARSGRNLDELLTRADELMYDENKTSGNTRA